MGVELGGVLEGAATLSSLVFSLSPLAIDDRRTGVMGQSGRGRCSRQASLQISLEDSR